MKALVRTLLLVVAGAFGPLTAAYGQFYSTGRGSSGVPLNEVRSPHYRIVAPIDYMPQALRLAHLLDTIRPYISLGIGTPPRSLPIILRTQNVLANGYVSWAPKREELYMIPPENTYALLWEKQLGVHEWRHVVQISTLRRGLTRIASWLVGEAGYGLGLFAMPRWQMEGDATLAETRLAEYGRGLQPEFTVGYRALLGDSVQRSFRRIDPWICGSYNTAYPDIYKFGYQVLSTLERDAQSAEAYGDVLRYSGCWPIFVFTSDIWLLRKEKTSVKRLTRKTFAELDSLWQPLAQVTENFETITQPPKKRQYISYNYPMAGSDVAAIKTHWDRPTRLVVRDTLGFERQVAQVGTLTARPVRRGNEVWWSEYRPHPVWEQESYSAIRHTNLATGKSKLYERKGRWFFITVTDQGFAAVGYDKALRAYIQYFDRQMKRASRYEFAGQDPISLHGLAYDSASKALAYIALDGRGMYLGAIENGQVRALTQPSVVSLSGLSASDGMLYFSSIESGKDEVHTLDLSNLVERRISTSRYGSGHPSAAAGKVVFTTVRGRGAALATTDTAQFDTLPSILWSRLPQNTTNRPTKRWRAPVVDTLTVVADSARHEVKRYRRLVHMPNVHSWAPIGLSPTDGNRAMPTTIGVTALMQSVLGDFEGSVAYGFYTARSWGAASLTYKGLPVLFSGGVQVGGGMRDAVGGPAGSVEADRSPYCGAWLTASAPLNLSSGAVSRSLNPYASVRYQNALLWNGVGYDYAGYANYNVGLSYSSIRRRSHRAIGPRLGYAVSLQTAGAFDARFAMLGAVVATGYLPGVALNHALMIRVGAQYQKLADLNFTSKILSLRGAPDEYTNRATTDYAAASMTYTAPIAYPDWGWEGVVYIRRIYGSLFADYATGSYLGLAAAPVRRDSYVVGATVGFDLNWLRSYDTSVSFTYAYPSYFSVGYAISF